MSAILQVTLLTILYVEIITGIFGNAFIALVNIMAWVKRRNISVVDQIFIALAISRIAFLLLMIITFLISELYTALITEKLISIIYFSWTFIHHFSIWLATCLSIFYFLKIANFSSSLFLYLKWRVINVVLVTLLVSPLILFINITVINIRIDVWIHQNKPNTFYNFTTSNVTQLSKLVLLINTMFTLIPFKISLITFILLIFSLWRHLKNMQNNAKCSRDINITAHIKTLQMVISFLLLYTMLFLVHVFQSWKYKVHHRNPFELFLQDVGLLFPSGHSCVLILGNSKLRQAFLSMVKCRLNDAEVMSS